MTLSDFGMTENDAEYILGSLLHSVILEIMTYGMYTVIYCVAMYLTLSRGTGRAQIRAIVLMTVMWLFCESRETEMVAALGGLYALGVTTTSIVSFLGVLFADMTMVWRSFRLYGGRWTIVILPMLSLSVGTVAYILKAVVQFSSAEGRIPVAQSTWKIIFLATTVFTNIFCTVAIIFRVLSVNGFTKSLKTYYGLLEIIVESVILYTSLYLIYIGLDVYTTYFTSEWDVRFYYPESLANVITGVAPTLIIARITAGHSRPDHSWVNTSKSLPGIKTTVHSVAESLHFARASVRDGLYTDIDIEKSSVFRGPGSRTVTYVDQRLNF